MCCNLVLCERILHNVVSLSFVDFYLIMTMLRFKSNKRNSLWPVLKANHEQRCADSLSSSNNIALSLLQC